MLDRNWRDGRNGEIDLVLGRDTEPSRLPWVGHRAKRWEIEPLRWVAVNAIYTAYRMADRVEASGSSDRTAWPAHVAPAHVHVVATGKDQAVFDAAEALAQGLSARGVEVLYDDRPKVSPGVKFADAELFGVPLVVVVGRGLADGVVEVRPRAGGESTQVAVADAVDVVAAQVTALLEG